MSLSSISVPCRGRDRRPAVMYETRQESAFAAGWANTGKLSLQAGGRGDGTLSSPYFTALLGLRGISSMAYRKL